MYLRNYKFHISRKLIKKYFLKILINSNMIFVMTCENPMEPSGLEPLTPCMHAGALPAELWPHEFKEQYLHQSRDFIRNCLISYSTLLRLINGF